jgi:hypothetical protein
MEQNDRKRKPVWPYSDPSFDGDPVELLLLEFNCELEVHAEMIGSPFFNWQHPVGLAAGVISFIDTYPGEPQHDRSMRLEAEQLIPRVQSGAANLDFHYFRFGMALAIWQLARSGMMSAAETLAWRQEQLSEGPKKRPEPPWYSLAADKAAEIWAKTPTAKPTAVASAIHRWLDDDAVWPDGKKVMPASSERIQRWLSKRGGATAFGPKTGVN